MFPTMEELAADLSRDAIGRRFLDKLEVGPVPEHAPELGPCIIWTRGKVSGYGMFRVNGSGSSKNVGQGRRAYAHVWLWERLNGPIPEGRESDHICHDWQLCKPERPDLCPHRACVAHIDMVPIVENRMRNDSAFARSARRTHCEGMYSPRDANGEIIGHDLRLPENRMWHRNPRKPGSWMFQCKPCDSIGKAERARKARERALQG